MIVKAPSNYSGELSRFKIFLAGSINMGAATNWQSMVESQLNEKDILILNPRRDDWDTSWEQKITNKQFKEQVDWELDAQKNADLILMYFDKEGPSPITLLELGLFKDSPMIVYCPEGYWRKGNVDIVCQRYGIRQASSLEDLISKAKYSYEDYKFTQQYLLQD